jgi:hypothetical protein
VTECTSVRGEWGQRCPDCGQMLPRQPKGGPSEKLVKVIPWNIDGPRWTPERIARYEAGGR